MARPIGIRVFKGDELVDVHVYERDIIKIGRLASAHLRLEDPKVSRIHAVIDIAAGRGEVSIIDMGSAEGTRVNGDKISRAQLNHGDEIGLGDSRLVVLLDEAEVRALGGDEGGGETAAAAEVANETEVMPGRGQLGSLPAPTDNETDVFEMGPVTALNELRKATLPADGTDVFAAPTGGEDSAPSQPSPAAAPPVGAPAPGSLPPGPALGAMPPMAMMAPLPPIPEDPITPENRHLELELRWAGTVVDVQRLREVPSFTIGVLDSCDMFIPVEDFGGGETFQLVEQAKGSSEWLVHVASQMNGTVTRGGQTQPVRDAAPGGSIVVSDDLIIELQLGYFTLIIRNVSKSRVVPVVPFVDMLFLNTGLVTLFAMISVLSTLLLLPTDLDDGEDDLAENASQFQTLILKPPPKNEFLDRFKEKQAQAKASAGDKGQAGKKTAKKTDQGKAAAKKNPQKPTNAEVVASKLAALGLDGESGGIASIFGASAAGSELEAALGNISGNRVADAYGSGGLGIRGAGPGGGGVGVGTLGVGRVGTVGRGSGNAAYGASTGNLGARKDRDVNISQGKPIILGSLDKEIIRRVVREHMAQIRYCYERELTKNPGIYGKIVMKWIINGQGKVTQAMVAETQMKNANVESCMAQKIRTWRFPKPKGGGIVIVNYPFVFKQGN